MTATTKKSPPTRTEDVYQAAAKLMVTKGFGGTSISDIAKAVGMTKAGLYHHITSKQDMLFKIMDHAMNIMQAEVIEPARQIDDPDQRLRMIIGTHTTIIIDRGQTFTILFSEIHHLNEDHQKALLQRVKGYRSLIMDSMEELEQTGKLRSGLDINIASRHTIQTIAGVARWHSFDLGENSQQIIEQTIDYAMAAILK